jgi:LysR family transcriptional regulator, low CO2-responsive transcriptional regulator
VKVCLHETRSVNNMRQSTLHQLKVFETVARLTSITRAAEELSLTQPTVSMQIKQLTQNVGVPLFEQIGKKLYLTESGQELLVTCRDVFDSLSRFEMKITDLQGMKQGKLKLATITTTKYFIPRALAPFCQLYPGVDIALEITNHERILDRLNENLDDLYIISKIPDRLDVALHPFLENPLVVVAPKTHPLAQEKNIPIERLQNEPFIMRERGSGTRDAVEQLFSKHGVSVKVRLELGGNEAIKQAIGVGFGISVLSQHTFTPESAISGGLTILDVQHFPIERYWYIVHPADKQLSILASTFFDFLQRESRGIADKMHRNLPT